MDNVELYKEKKSQLVMKVLLYSTCFSWKHSSLCTVIPVHYCVSKNEKKEKNIKYIYPGVPEPQT